MLLLICAIHVYYASLYGGNKDYLSSMLIWTVLYCCTDVVTDVTDKSYIFHGTL